MSAVRSGVGPEHSGRTAAQEAVRAVPRGVEGLGARGFVEFPPDHEIRIDAALLGEADWRQARHTHTLRRDIRNIVTLLSFLSAQSLGVALFGHSHSPPLTLVGFPRSPQMSRVYDSPWPASHENVAGHSGPHENRVGRPSV